MNLNATLIAQGITFFLFIWMTMRFVWPMIKTAMDQRQKKIADGLAAAEKGVRDLENASAEAKQVLDAAKNQAADLLNQANKRSSEIIEESKKQAREEGVRLVATARVQIEQEVTRAREQLRKEVASLAIVGAGRILGREIDAGTHADLLDKVANEL